MFSEHPELLLAAAFITGVFSLVSLILSKEIKISEARLNWNGELRAELSKMISGLKYISQVAAVRLKIKGENASYLSDREIRDLRSDLKEHYVESMRAFYHANLCVDPNFHPTYRQLIHKIKEIDQYFWGGCENLNKLIECYEEVEELAKKVLVLNWESVEKGEPTFRWAKRVLVGVIILIPLAWAYLSISAESHGIPAGTVSGDIQEAYWAPAMRNHSIGLQETPTYSSPLPQMH